MSRSAPLPKPAPRWTIEDLLIVLGKLTALDYSRFIKTHFPTADLEGWERDDLLQLCLNIFKSWEEDDLKNGISHEDFLIRCTAALSRASFEAFVRLFWDEIPVSQPLLWNWHLRVYTEEIQCVAEEILTGSPRSHDLVCNVSPGSSKSSVWSVLFPCWVWSRKPEARLITASHTEVLATDLAMYAREVMRSSMYRLCFPEIEFTETQDAKGYYRNTEGGERFTCTVAGKSPTGHHAHFIICLPGESSIITDRGRISIAEIVDKKLSVRVLGYDHFTGEPSWQEIEEYEVSQGRPVSRITFSDGTYVEATEEHPVYVIGRGYVAITDLNPGDEVIYVREMQGLQFQGEIEHRGETGSDRLLYSEVLGKTSEGDWYSTMSCLWEDVLFASEAQGEDKEGSGVLFSFMPSKDYNGRKSSQVQQEENQLRGLWEGSMGIERRGKNQRSVLQLQMSWEGKERKEQSKVAENFGDLRDVWKGYGESTRFYSQVKLLFKGVCRQRALAEDERRRQFQLYTWRRLLSLSDGVSSDEKDHQKAGSVPLLSLWSGGGIPKKEIDSTPRRSQQVQQCSWQSGISVQELSRRSAWGQEKSSGTSTKTVVSIIPGVRLPPKVYNLRVANTHNYFANGVLLHNCDDPIDPKKVLSEAERKIAADFLTQVIPSRRMRGKHGDICATMLIMQRLGLDDPTDVMLKIADKEKAVPIRHICLPAELTDDVSPPELRRFYTEFNEDAEVVPNGLMDPIRLNRRTLDEQLAILAEWGYAGQYLQKPRPIAGGMFKRKWLQFVPSAPLRAKRIRYWDRASSRESSSCFTAGVLMAYDGERFYVEDVVHDRWEPDERNAMMLATARKDRMRYGKWEPTIYVEAEGGSSGRDAWLGIVRTLVGFSVREDRVQGSKDVRAEPWATQWAAGNVYIVDNGEISLKVGKAGWDIDGYISEHENFRPEPGKRLGRYKDMTDASSGAFNLLVGLRRAYLPLYTYALHGQQKNQGRWIVACSEDELSLLDIGDHRALIVVFTDPSCPSLADCPTIITNDSEGVGEKRLLPPSAMPSPDGVGTTCGSSVSHDLPPPPFPRHMEKLTLAFADLDPADYQANYGAPIAPWQRPITDLQMSDDQAKKFWSYALRKYEQPWQVLILVDKGGEDRRALSTAMAVADMLRIPRSAIFLPGYDNKEELIEDEPPNQWVFEVIKATKHKVVA